MAREHNIISPNQGTYVNDVWTPIGEEEFARRAAPYPVGSRYVAFAGAPGTGRVVYEITRNDATGLWGREVENTIRELTAEEVR